MPRPPARAVELPARPLAAAALLLAAATLAVACGPRYARTAVHETRDLRVTLRSELRDGEPVERGFEHPATISGVRVANILARIDVREGGERRPAVSDALLYPVGEKVAAALGRASPAEEVVVQAVRTERRLGIFTQERLTSFVCWVQEGRLVVDLSRVDAPLEGGPDRDLPEPWPGREAMDFRALPGRGLVQAGPQAVAAEWRSELFRDPAALRRGPSGGVERREILMESPAGASPGPGGAAGESAEALPGDLPPETRRALAELREARRRGEVTEAEYRARRRELLAR